MTLRLIRRFHPFNPGTCVYDVKLNGVLLRGAQGERPARELADAVAKALGLPRPQVETL